MTTRLLASLSLSNAQRMRQDTRMANADSTRAVTHDHEKARPRHGRLTRVTALGLSWAMLISAVPTSGASAASDATPRWRDPWRAMLRQDGEVWPLRPLIETAAEVEPSEALTPQNG